MSTQIDLLQILGFIQKNWFKMAVAILGFYLFFIKQLSFQILVQAPEKTEQHYVKRKPTEKITQSQPKVAIASDKIERLEIPFIGNHRPVRNAISELNSVGEETKHAYIQRFAKVARAEQKKFGIPASVIIAMALHQSSAGKRDMAIESANHFALPCSSDWKSACKSYQGKSYRKYQSAWLSYRDFSKYLDANYANLKGGNYTNYVNAFQNNGFGDDDNIAENLTNIIEGYRLYELDGN